MDLKTQDLPRDAGHGFVGHAEEFLGQALGRQFSLKELADFAETVGATILGSMYAILRAQEGKEKSEAWLKKAMGTLSGAIRHQGADALVKMDVHVKDMPNNLAKRADLHAPPPVESQAEVAQPQGTVATAPVKCVCKPAADGSCWPCLNKLSTSMETAMRVMVEMAKVGKKTESVCPACKVKHGDEAIAKIIPSVVRNFSGLGGPREEILDNVSNIVMQLGVSIGVQEMPLTLEALQEVAEEGKS